MSDHDPFVDRLKGAYTPGPLDSAKFDAALRTRQLRTFATVLGGTGVGVILGLLIFARGPAPSPVATAPSPVATAPEIAATVVVEAPHEVSGVAMSIDGQPLVGAVISDGKANTKTDADGRFTLVAVGDTVSAHLDGYSTAWARVDSGPVRLVALPVAYQGLIDGASGGTLAGPDGMSLTLPARGVRDATGAIVDGAVHVRWTTLRHPEELAAAPGTLATRIGAEEVPLQSFGMVEVVLTDDAGDRLDLVAEAEIGVPLRDGQPFEEGASVGLYAFDEDSGLWNHEGQGRVHDGRMIATVGHFSWWNCDEPIETHGCVCGNVHATANVALPVEVQATGVDYLTYMRAPIGNGGAYCMDLLGGAAVRMSVVRWSHDDTCLAGSTVVVASAAGTSVQLDPSKCAQADIQADLIPCRGPIVPPAVAAPQARPGSPIDKGIGKAVTLTINRIVDGVMTTKTVTLGANGLPIEEANRIRREADLLGAPPPDLLHLVVWSSPRGPTNTSFQWRCQVMGFETWRTEPLIDRDAWVPVPSEQGCELRISSPDLGSFGFVPHAGTTDVFCNFDTASGCRLGMPGPR